MPAKKQDGKIAQQVTLARDIDPPVDLSKLPNDADDKSDADRPKTDHEAEGWREDPPVKP